KYDFGIGRPLVQIIQEPVEQAMLAYDKKQYEKALAEARRTEGESAPALKPTKLPARLPAEYVAKIRDDGKPAEDLDVVLIIRPDDSRMLMKAAEVSRPRALTTLSVQEALVVYFKVSLVAGIVIASPWVFWWIWAFVAAGLYPHEKRLVHVY